MRENWIETTLGDISDFITVRIAPAKLDFATPYVGLQHLVPRIAQVSDWDTVEQVSSSVTPFEPGDTLFGRLRPYLHKVAFADFSGTCSPELLVLRSNEKSDAGFLYLLCSLDSTIGQCVAMSAGTRMPRTSASDLASIEVQLPPINEQKRIVDLMSSVDSYIAALQQQADAARTLRTAAVEQALADGDDEWGHVTMGEVLTIARGGSPRPIHDYITASDDGVNWIKIGDAAAHDKYIYSTSQKIRPEGVDKSRRVFPGDFLLSNSMSFGRPYILRTDGCIHDGWLLLSGVAKHFDEDFLYNVLMSHRVQQQFNSLAAGSGVRNLNIDVASEVRTPLPPIEVQKEIGSLANSIDDLVLSTEQTLAMAVELRAGVVSELLSGAHEIPESYDRLLGAA